MAALGFSRRSRTEHLCEMGETGVCGMELGESGLSWFHRAATEIAASFWEHFPYSS